MKTPNLYKGTLSTIILKLLTENEKLYGYEITKMVKTLTNNELEITEGALYPTLHKLEAEELVITEKVNIGKRVRKYYILTKKGKQVTKQKIMELEAFMGAINVLFFEDRVFKI